MYLHNTDTQTTSDYKSKLITVPLGPSMSISFKNQIIHLIDVDGGVRLNIVDNTYNGGTCLSFIKKNNKRISMYIFLTIKASSGEYKLVHIYKQIYIYIFSYCFFEKRNQVAPYYKCC